MKFPLKMPLCMLAVPAVLFGAGSSLLISESFEDSLERGKAAAPGDYRTARIVNSMDAYLDRDAIVKTMEQLYQQNIASRSALRLSTGEKVLYESRGAQSPFIQNSWAIAAGNFSSRVRIRSKDEIAAVSGLKIGRKAAPVSLWN